MLAGVNLPVFGDAYGYDLAPNALRGTGPRNVDPMTVYRPLLQAREIGFQAARIWLCEDGEGLLMDAGAVCGIHPVLVESIAIIQECAGLCGLKLYWTLLDGHGGPEGRNGLARSILRDTDHAARFAEYAAAPLARRFDPRVTFAVEIVNAPEALADALPATWAVLGGNIKLAADAVRAEHPGCMITAGTRRAAVTRLWHSGAGVNAVDIHVDAGVELPSRAELAAETSDAALRTPAVPLIAGSWGLAPGVDDRGIAATLAHAARESYAAVFCWRLQELIDSAAADPSATALAHYVKTALAERPHP